MTKWIKLEPVENYRFKRVPVSIKFLYEIGNIHYKQSSIEYYQELFNLLKEVMGDIPEDSKLISVDIDYAFHGVYFTIYHDSFDIVPNGQVIPEMILNIHTDDIDRFFERALKK